MWGVWGGGFCCSAPRSGRGRGGERRDRHTGTRTGTYTRMLHLPFSDLPLKKCPIFVYFSDFLSGRFGYLKIFLCSGLGVAGGGSVLIANRRSGGGGYPRRRRGRGKGSRGMSVVRVGGGRLNIFFGGAKFPLRFPGEGPEEPIFSLFSPQDRNLILELSVPSEQLILSQWRVCPEESESVYLDVLTARDLDMLRRHANPQGPTDNVIFQRGAI